MQEKNTIIIADMVPSKPKSEQKGEKLLALNYVNPIIMIKVMQPTLKVVKILLKISEECTPLVTIQVLAIIYNTDNIEQSQPNIVREQKGLGIAIPIAANNATT